jgi:hypothetical protein
VYCTPYIGKKRGGARTQGTFYIIPLLLAQVALAVQYTSQSRIKRCSPKAPPLSAFQGLPSDLSHYSGSHFTRSTAIASDLRVACPQSLRSSRPPHHRPCRLSQPLSQKIWLPSEDKTTRRLENFSPHLGRHISQQQALHSPSTKLCMRVSGLRHASPFSQQPCPFAAGPPSTALQNL